VQLFTAIKSPGKAVRFFRRGAGLDLLKSGKTRQNRRRLAAYGKQL
jgi:hypothetical protein